MHPIAGLDPEQVPMCRSQISALEHCHISQSFWRKAFMGACNETRLELDQCLREEKQIRRKANLEKSKRFQQYVKQREKGQQQQQPSAQQQQRDIELQRHGHVHVQRYDQQTPHILQHYPPQ